VGEAVHYQIIQTKKHLTVN